MTTPNKSHTDPLNELAELQQSFVQGNEQFGQNDLVPIVKYPWLNEPPGSISLFVYGNAAIPPQGGPGPPFLTANDVINFTVPSGYDGIINRISQNIISTGIQTLTATVTSTPPPDNEIPTYDSVRYPPNLPPEIFVYNLYINNRGVPYYLGIPDIGSINFPVDISPIRIYSGDNVKLQITNSGNNNVPDTASRVYGRMYGYLFPSKGQA